MTSNRILGWCLIFLAILFLSPRTTSAATQGSECSAQESLAVLKANDPVYPDAMALAETLRNHGFIVKCVLQSKMVGLFEGEQGAALYRTNRGDFEGLFLPKSQIFAVRPIEKRHKGRYIYSFAGAPHPTGGSWDCAKQTYFTQRANQLLVTSDEQLLADLDKALASAQTS
jgi:hypothetical protein